MEIIKGIFSETFWYIAPLLMTLTVALAGAINGAFKIKKGMWPQIVAWVVGALLAVAAWALQLIEFGEPVWLGVVMLAIVVGLSSNGVYDIPTIKAFVDKWFYGGSSYFAEKETYIADVFEETGLAGVIRESKNEKATRALEDALYKLSHD